MCCPWLQAETKVATILGIFSFLLVLLVRVWGTNVQNPRRGCRRVSKFCMGSKLIEIKIPVKQKSDPPPPFGFLKILEGGHLEF